MTTAELIRALALNLKPASFGAGRNRLRLGVLAGIGVAVALLMTWLGPRDLGQAVQTVPFWMKAAYTGVLAILGLHLSERLARPDGQARSVLPAVLVVVAAMGALGLAQYLSAPPDERLAVWLGMTWNRCPYLIMALAAPVFVGLLWAMRRLAPGRPAGAGAAAGLAAGAIGATVYGLHCPETTAAFVATWYTLGIAFCTAAGGLIGLRALRW